MRNTSSVRGAQPSKQEQKAETNGKQFTEELNEIATMVQEAMVAAEEKCTKMPKAPYSLKLANLNKIIRYWKTVK